MTIITASAVFPFPYVSSALRHRYDRVENEVIERPIGSPTPRFSLTAWLPRGSRRRNNPSPDLPHRPDWRLTVWTRYSNDQAASRPCCADQVLTAEGTFLFVLRSLTHQQNM